MIIIKSQYKSNTMKLVALKQQQAGWLYESHLWVVKDEANITTPKVCSWCGAKSPKDMEVIPNTVCPNNPLLKNFCTGRDPSAKDPTNDG